MRTAIAITVLAVSPAALAGAIYSVDIYGEVEFNQVNSGPYDAVNTGDQVRISFLLDAGDFVNDGMFPTRGYTIQAGTFGLTMGSVESGLADPFATYYFVLRNNDPAVDGFFLSAGTQGPTGLDLDVPGVFGQFQSQFSVGYTGDTLMSLDIDGAVGTYDFTGLTSFYFGVTDGPFDAMGFLYSHMTIQLVPAPGAAALFGAAGLLAVRRRR